MQDCFLFVYGTLLSGAGTQMGEFLQANSQFVAKGWMQGRLYHISYFPGAIYDETSVSKVMGEVYLIRQTERVLSLLDRYEGMSAVNGDIQLFVRMLVPVETEAGRLMSYTYLYNQPTDRLTLIPDGDYLGFNRHSLS
ncbi:MAG: gamma-glutamylcyclotransferase family protein [Bacteroidia bacterium]|jgi:gamma-glutamylcyclotransferase (GGCT)/AIG2-like uncharacterized protein YtfP|nr:gamma-glutamylcyclotransferase family protein [Bacteroidia bacterium]